MTNVSDSEQVMCEDQQRTDSEDEVLAKSSEDKQKSETIDDDSSSDDEVLVLKPDPQHNVDDKSKQTVNKMLQLPVSRIKTIMKSSPELANVKAESYVLITRATELFVQYLAQRAHEAAPTGNRTLEYNALSSVVAKDESLDFLEEIVPFKIKMKDYWEKYGYPKKPAAEIEIVEIDSNGSSASNGHAVGSSGTSSHTESSQKQTPNANSLNTSASATPKPLKRPSMPKPTKLSSASKTPQGKTQKTIDSTMKTTPKNPGGTPVNGLTKVTPVDRPSGKSFPEVICIDD